MVEEEPDTDMGTRTDMWNMDDHGIAYARTKDGLDVDEVGAWNHTKDHEVDSGGVGTETIGVRNSN